MDWTERVSNAPEAKSRLATSFGIDEPDAKAASEPKKHGIAFKRVAAVALVSAAAIGGFAYAKSRNPVDLSGKALGAAEYIARGFHAIPAPKPSSGNPGLDFLRELPSMHRLMNVVGMVSGFASVQYLSNIIFGCKINGSKCEEIPREKVPAPLRFLHGIVPYNPFSDAPRDQWLKVTHQMLPAVGGAIGAVKGSEIFFNNINTRGRDFKKWMKQSSLNPIEADSAARFVQGQSYAILAGIAACFSAASAIGPWYGVTLNKAFNDRNGGQVAWTPILRKLSGNTSRFGHGPEKGVAEVLKSMEMTMRDGNYERFARDLVETGISPLVKHTPQEQQEIITRFRDMFEGNALQVTSQKEVGQLREYMRKQVLQEIAGTPIQDLKIGDYGTSTDFIKIMPGVADKIKEIISRIDHPPLVPRPPSHSRA